MGDLISRSMLLENLELLAKFQPEYKQSTILGVCATIRATPAVDAEPVRHGRWIRTFCGGDDYTRTTRLRYRCSECGLYSGNKYPYCHCGAKLDLEETE